MVSDSLRSRLEMFLCMLKEQEERGVDRSHLEAIAHQITKTQGELTSALEMEEARGIKPTVTMYEVVEMANGQTYTRRVKDPQEFAYGRPKRWTPRRTVRKAQSRVVKNAHPTWIPWHGRLV